MAQLPLQPVSLISLTASVLVVPGCSSSPSEPRFSIEHTEIRVYASATEKDAAEAFRTLGKFLTAWENREFSRAATYVEVSLRDGWRENLERKAIKVDAITDLSVQPIRRGGGRLRARVHVDYNEGRSFGLDMIKTNEGWRIYGG